MKCGSYDLKKKNMIILDMYYNHEFFQNFKINIYLVKKFFLKILFFVIFLRRESGELWISRNPIFKILEAI